MNFKAIVAEFIGTFAFCFVGILAVYASGDLLAIALAHGLAIAVMASATAAISGGHLNPAVTIAMLVAGKINLANAVGYVVSQFLAGFAAVAAVTFTVVSARAGSNAYGETGWVGTPTLVRIELPQAFALEAIATFILMFVIYGTAVDKRGPKVGALFIGLAVTIGILAIGPETGAAMNPARWLAPALVSETTEQWLVYLVGTTLGAVVAALIYRYVLDEKPWAKESEAAEEITM